jgi:transcriptional regulator with XRE-family HTH domain
MTNMKIDNLLTDEAVLEALGQRLAAARLARQMTQARLAEEAGLSKRTVERIEAGDTSQVSSLIRVLRVLELLDGLNQLVPEAGPRPLDLLKLKGRQRKRASSKPAGPDSEEGWSWGDPE